MGKGGAGVGSLIPGLRFGLFARIHAISHLGGSVRQCVILAYPVS